MQNVRIQYAPVNSRRDICGRPQLLKTSQVEDHSYLFLHTTLKLLDLCFGISFAVTSTEIRLGTDRMQWPI